MVRMHATVHVDAPAERLATLPFDFEHYVRVEPRLRSARWLTQGGPRVGARAEVVADIPFRLPLLARIFGAPHVAATVVAWTPPERSAVRFEARRFTGWAEITLSPRGRRSVVELDGEVRPRSRLGEALLAPATPVVERLATRAIARGVVRAASALGDEA